MLPPIPLSKPMTDFRPDRRRILGLALGLAGLPLLARPGLAAALSDRDKADIARVEGLFNGIRTMEARFTQVDSNGGYAEGKLMLRRPGRLRFEYSPPTPLVIIADGTWLVVYDKENPPGRPLSPGADADRRPGPRQGEIRRWPGGDRGRPGFPGLSRFPSSPPTAGTMAS